MKIKIIGWIVGIFTGIIVITVGASMILSPQPGSSPLQTASRDEPLEKGAEESSIKVKRVNQAGHGVGVVKGAENTQIEIQPILSNRNVLKPGDWATEQKREIEEKNRDDLLALKRIQREKRLKDGIRLQIQQKRKKNASRQFHQVVRIRNQIDRIRNVLNQYEQDVHPREQEREQINWLYGKIALIRDEVTQQQKQIRSTKEPTQSQMALARSLDRDLNQLNQLQSNAHQRLTMKSRNRPGAMQGKNISGNTQREEDS